MQDVLGWGRAWVGAAAKAGRVELMQRLAARFPRTQHSEPGLLVQVAFGCPLAALQQYYEPWGTGLLQGIEPKLGLLLAAAGSPTPDWAAKCDWLWARWGAAAAAFRIYSTRVDSEAIAAIMQHSDFSQRLHLLASRGLGSCLEGHAPTAAGALGSTAAVEFCLDQLPALLRQQAAAPFGAAGGGGPLPAEDPAAQQQVNDFMELIALAAAEQGHVAVLRLLRGRGFVFRARHVRAALEEWAQENVATLRYLLLEDPADLAQGDGAAAADWSTLFRDAAFKGADLPALRHLHEQLGAAIKLVEVAIGGGEEALSWAVAALEAAGQAPAPLSCDEFGSVLSSDNWAAADWLVRHGLAPAKQELLRHMLSEKYALIPDLQWVVGKGQDGVQASAQHVQWTAELRAALVRMQHKYGIVSETPCRRQWLAELVGAVTVELAATAGGPPRAGQQG
ncbi:hypothetical protein HXX76_014587 [Chlamydomonas incerta]|uniref:Uncharacterized protein n=1 Tax=Chlamydomonas incerta TaxID=51695 RepID=A0A835VSN8_CHLIN|nr:hypothetical protein HXX76_014587 [Chlamydomonas incerta]|eukprot:KAG2424378.1 hypothetical protein HXX76_014587 [Chlamydomonas incerta]